MSGENLPEMPRPAASKAGRIKKRTLITVISAVLLLLLFPGIFFLFHIPYRLAVGWFNYLYTVLPQTQINLELILCSFAALAGGVLGLQWLMPRVLPVGRWFWRWSLAWCAVLVILFATSIAAIGVVHQLGWLFRTPQWIEDRGFSYSARSSNSARQVLGAARAYASDHDGRLPETCRDLFPDILTDARILLVQVDSSGPGEPWVYAGAGLDDNDFADLPVLWSPRPNNRGKRIVGRLNGSVIFIKEDEFQAALAQLREHWERKQSAVKP